mmetsp:Transcript_13338/g.18220  ORF Transcript_13338/g.18220 Transcript_13338/m.18220 type:complete len:300 (+) Transcript_13338:42-941(+)
MKSISCRSVQIVRKSSDGACNASKYLTNGSVLRSKSSTSRLVICQAKSKNKGKNENPTSGGRGFGSKNTASSASSPARSWGEGMFSQLPKDLKFEDQAEYFLFARKTKQDSEPGRWLPLGDITLQIGDSVDKAVKERRVLLKEFAQLRYLNLKVLKKGEDLEYAARVQRAPIDAGAAYSVPGIVPIDVTSAVTEKVPAKLQLLSDLEWTMSDKKGMLDDVVEKRRQELGKGFEGSEQRQESDESVVDKIVNFKKLHSETPIGEAVKSDEPKEGVNSETKTTNAFLKFETKGDGSVIFKF